MNTEHLTALREEPWKRFMHRTLYTPRPRARSRRNPYLGASILALIECVIMLAVLAGLPARVALGSMFMLALAAFLAACTGLGLFVYGLTRG